MARLKEKVRNFRCSQELDELLRNAAHEVGCRPSTLLRDLAREGSETILNNPSVAKELRRRYAVS
jgi:hypothetical protein